MYFYKYTFLLFILTGYLNTGLSKDINHSGRFQRDTSKDVCGALKSTISEETYCIQNELETRCPTSAKINTTIKKQCRPYYSNDGKTYVTYSCEENGEWNSGQNLCEAECGIKRTGAKPLIVGGEETEKYEFPWVAAIYVQPTKICSGTIISPHHVLTVAHCYTDWYGTPYNTDTYVVRVGKHYRSPDIYEESAQERKIKTLTIHENYEGKERNRFDISLIEIDEPFILSSKVHPVCIDWSSIYQDELRDGTIGTVTGWGFTEEAGPRSEVLRKVDVIYRSPRHCHTHLPSDVRQKLYSSDKFCAGYINASKGICHGDAGAGLYFQSSTSKKYFIIGMVSSLQASKSGCNANHYALYTKVSDYMEWLTTAITDAKNFSMKFQTRIGEDTRSSFADCSLPDPIPDGNFSVPGMQYFANQIVPLSSLLILTCGDGSIQHFYCIGKNEWSNLNGTKCRKRGTCPSITKTDRDELACKLKGATVDCTEPRDETILRIRCKSWYTRLDSRPYYCTNGSWDREISSCVPECGTKSVAVATLIYGGTETEQNEYPWVVIIYNSEGNHICSGTIISRTYIVSAAHCFTNASGAPLNKVDYTIVAGKHFREKTKFEKHAQERKIKSLTIYPDYKGNIQNFIHDIALIELEGPLNITAHSRPICIDWENSLEEFDFRDGVEGVIVGWGKSEIADHPSEKLKKLVVPYRDKRECIKHFSREFADKYYTSDKFCAGYVNRNSSICQGDSGGGLTFKSNGKFYIRGIASLTPRTKVQCDPNIYALYTKVSNYIEWIDNITKRQL